MQLALPPPRPRGSTLLLLLLQPQVMVQESGLVHRSLSPPLLAGHLSPQLQHDNGAATTKLLKTLAYNSVTQARAGDGVRVEAPARAFSLTHTHTPHYLSHTHTISLSFSLSHAHYLTIFLSHTQAQICEYTPTHPPPPSSQPLSSLLIH